MVADAVCVDFNVHGYAFMPQGDVMLSGILSKRKIGSMKSNGVEDVLEILRIASSINLTLNKADSHAGNFNGAHAHASGKHVCIRYHSTQEPVFLDIAAARRYLDWLCECNVGTHHEMGGCNTSKT